MASKFDRLGLGNTCTDMISREPAGLATFRTFSCLYSPHDPLLDDLNPSDQIGLIGLAWLDQPPVNQITMEHGLKDRC